MIYLGILWFAAITWIGHDIRHQPAEDSMNDALYEAWLDAWCVMWHHIGCAAVEATQGGVSDTAHLWYARGVTTGLLQARFTDERFDALMCEASFASAATDEGEPF